MSGKRVGRSRDISFRGENVKGQKRKVMSVNVALIQQHYPWEVRGSGSGWREMGAVSDSLIRFYYLLSPEQGAGWLTGLPGGIAGADGANGIRMLGPHLSVVMAG